jgi:CDP-diacylglycerol--glycerol-3-phosphate 3-phosphatidyltransferase
MASALQETFSPRNLPNAFSATRIALVPVLLALAALGQAAPFTVVLAAAFATDAIDGFLARRFRLDSPLGARLDSLADHALWLALPLATWLLRPELVRAERLTVTLLLASLALAALAGFARFGRMPSYHTWAAKTAAVLLATALLSIYAGGPLWPFRVATLAAVVATLEELLITALLPEWRADVRSWRAALRLRAAHAAGSH